MPDNDPGVLAREMRAEAKYVREIIDHPRQAQLLTRAADYLESLSAPVEDEEKVCRLILAEQFTKTLAEKHDDEPLDRESRLYLAALWAMREYARRLRAPGDAELRASGAAEFARFLYPGEDQEKERAAYRQGASDCRAPVGVTVGEPLADGRK